MQFDDRLELVGMRGRFQTGVVVGRRICAKQYKIGAWVRKRKSPRILYVSHKFWVVGVDLWRADVVGCILGGLSRSNLP